MNRRDFLRSGGGMAGAVASASTAAGAQETTTSPGTDEGTQTTTGADGEGPTEEVVVGPGGQLIFEPDELEITPGTTVRWVWDSDRHNVVAGEQPDGANWEGTPGAPDRLFDTGYSYTHTFEVPGRYNYWCEPHKSAGMIADVIVREPGAGGGVEEQDPEEWGVPLQPHYVGIATFLAIILALIFTFFFLKYGVSSHTSSPNRK